VDKFYQAQKWTSTSSLTSDNYSKYSKTSAGRFTDNLSYSIQSKFTDNFGSMTLSNKSAPSKSRKDQFGGITRWPGDLSLEIRRRTAALKIFKDIGEEF